MKMDRLEIVLGDDVNNINSENFLSKVEKAQCKEKDKKELIKSFENRRIPYVRNSGKYGLNTSLKNMKDNIETLTKIIIESNISISENDLVEYKPTDDICSVCNINKTTKLDINLKERIDSKYNFLFRGAEKSGFKNNGTSSSAICFECEFFNLMCLFYISLKRPVAFAYTNNLKEMKFANYKIMLDRKLSNDKGFYKKLVQDNISSLKIYDFNIDTNKGIILNFNSIVDYKDLLKSIELIDSVDKYIFSRESATMKRIAKTMIKNNALISLKELLLSNIIVIKEGNGTRDIDKFSTYNNINEYLYCLYIVYGKEANKLFKSNSIYSKAGSRMSVHMDETRRKNFVFKILQMLKTNDRDGILQTIMHTLAAYNVPIEKGFVEGIMKSEEIELNTNIGLFLQELMKEGKKNE